MINISAVKSPALALTTELFNKWKSEEEWISKFEEEISNARDVYDQLNHEIDAAASYPKLEEATAIYETWTQRITKLVEDENRLSRFASEITLQMTKLRSLSFSTEELGKISFLQKDAGAEIKAYHYQLTPQMADLEGRLERIKAISKKAFLEIPWIRKHPHARLAQTIERIKNGQHASSFLSITQDRLIRNTSNAYEAIVGSSDERKPPSLP